MNNLRRRFTMKKFLLIACLILAVLVASCTAGAETKPTVSFTKTNGSVNGGFTYTITLKIKTALQQDLDIPLACKETGEGLNVKMPAGSTDGNTEYKTESVEKAVTRTFLITQGDEYIQRGNNLILKILPMPKAYFYSSVNFGYVGKTSTINIEFRNPSNFVSGTTLQLRDQDGNVLDEKTWKSSTGLHGFKVNVTKEMTGKRLLSVWMGDQKISEKNGYGAFTDTSVKAVRQVPTQEKLVAITLDCGWYGRQMPDILPILKKYDVHCTFFMTGFFIRTFTDEAKAALADGHEIGNHTNTHPKMAAQKSKINRLSQLAVPNKNAKNLLGVTPRVFRPPYGDYDRELMALCRAEGMEIIIWSVDSHDWDVKGGYSKDPDKVFKRVTKKIEPGWIFLFHLDGKPTPDVLDRLIPYLQEQGYKCVTVSELLASGGMDLPPLVEEGTDEFVEEDPNQDIIPADASEG